MTLYCYAGPRETVWKSLEAPDDAAAQCAINAERPDGDLFVLVLDVPAPPYLHRRGKCWRAAFKRLGRAWGAWVGLGPLATVPPVPPSRDDLC